MNKILASFAVIVFSTLSVLLCSYIHADIFAMMIAPEFNLQTPSIKFWTGLNLIFGLMFLRSNYVSPKKAKEEKEDNTLTNTSIYLLGVVLVHLITWGFWWAFNFLVWS